MHQVAPPTGKGVKEQEPEASVSIVHSINSSSYVYANDGDHVLVRYTLQASQAQLGLGVEVESVVFKVRTILLCPFV